MLRDVERTQITSINLYFTVSNEIHNDVTPFLSLSLSQGNSTRSLLCPSGYFCPSGTGYPLPCPVGSLSIARGLRGVEECPPCPPGLFCDKAALAEPSGALPCNAG